MSELAGRLLRLLSLLQSRREWSGRELAERLGVTDRTVRRDIERLRALDYPVTGTTGTAGGYRLVSGRNLPPLVLSDDEAVAVAVGLAGAGAGGVAGMRESSVSALAKLSEVMPARLRPRVAAVGAATVVGPADAPQVNADVLATLAGCCRAHEIVAFDYRPRSTPGGARRVEAYELVSTQRRWYLIGYDLTRDDWRTFRVDRISDVRPTRHRYPPRELPAADAAAYLAAAMTGATYRHRVRLVVPLTAAEVRAAFFGSIPGQVTDRPEGGCELLLTADSAALLVQYVAGVVALGTEYTVTASAEVAALLRRVGRSLAGDQANPQGEDADRQRGRA